LTIFHFHIYYIQYKIYNYQLILHSWINYYNKCRVTFFFIDYSGTEKQLQIRSPITGFYIYHLHINLPEVIANSLNSTNCIDTSNIRIKYKYQTRVYLLINDNLTIIHFIICVYLLRSIRNISYKLRFLKILVITII